MIKEAARIARADEFIERLPAQSAAINKEGDTAGTSKFDEAIDEIAGGERLSAARGHLDESARTIVSERLFEQNDGTLLGGPEVATIERRHQAELATDS